MARIRLKLLGLQIGLALILALTLVLPAGAQGAVTLNIDRLESGKGGAMKAYVTVRDENGVPISGLVPANFAIVEDNKTSFPPDQVTTQVNTTARLTIALVIDLSSTMRGQALNEAKAASQKLLETLLNQPNDPDRAAFFGISGAVNVDDLAVNEESKREVNFTNDRNKILNVINAIEATGDPASRTTPLYDALFRVIKITARQQAPRAIVVITDGIDVVSKLKADDPISEANRNNIPIFPVGFSADRVDDTYLSRLALRTGGTYDRAREAARFTELFQQILNKLNEQYVLSYQSRLPLDSQPHAVIVRVDSPKGKAFDDEIFRFTDLPTAAPTAVPISQPAPTAAPGTPVVSVTAAPPPTPAPTVAPTPETVPDKVRAFLTDKKNLPWLIGAVALLAALLALVLFLIWRRSRREAAREEVAEVSSGGFAPAEQPVTIENQVLPPTAGPAEGGIGPTAPGQIPPTEFPPGQTPQGWPQPQPQWPQPQPQPYPPPGQFPTPLGVPPAGGTMILPRGAQPPPVLAMLINRRQPQQRFDLTPSTDIGRATTNNICLQNTTVSRQHAKIKEEKGEFRVFDLGSANGTFVNNNRVTDPVVLKDGDLVRFGELEFTFKRLV